ncbi:MAG: transpeptidase family protein, partial [Deltaproteobacteria bacterium]|nr:transpeptidase family protein [Deltaproteobacteria bacterium]
KRGVIYDRHRQELALTAEMESIFTHPQNLKNPDLVCRRLAPVLGFDRQRLVQQLSQGKSFVFLKRRATPQECETVRAQGLQGIAFTKEAQRFYPYMELASHVVGFVGSDPDGLEGLERQYNRFLKSPFLYEPSVRDALGRTLYLKDVEAVQENEGHSLILTLDKNIQYLTEKELKKGVLKAQAKGGMALVLNPKTGEILALANYPTYNLNNPKDFPAANRRNQIITDTLEPGSTFKTFLLAAALEEKKFSVGDMIFCENGSYRVGSHVIHDVHRYGWLSFADVIQKSSNIGATKIGRKLGPKTFHAYIRKFGFGSTSGIDLPGEVPGLVWPYQRWGEIEASNIAFGQGISVTPLQMATALGAIANDGRLMKPHLVSQVLDQKGQPAKSFPPQAVRQVLSPETARLMRQLLVRVTEPGGTATQAAIEGVLTGGKTGTAQKVTPDTHRYAPGKYVSTFMGFLPAENPALVILVIVDEPRGSHYGGVVAAPVFKAIAEQSLPLIGLRRLTPPAPSQTPAIKPESAPWLVAQRALEDGGNPPPLSAGPAAGHQLMPDLRGLSLRKVLEVLKGYEIELKVEGSGKAILQKPLPGTVLAKGTLCQIQFRPHL